MTRPADHCDFFRGARVRCGRCGAQKDFSAFAEGPDVLARKAGWKIEWHPQPFVRCPSCKKGASRDE